MGYLFGRSKLKPWLVIILGALHGLSCEIAQSFTLTRQAELMDLASDIIGVTIGLWLALFHSRLSCITRIK